MKVRPSERGAALLAVLLLVAVMASLSAVALEKMTLASRTASNAAALEQERAFALGAERYALLRVGDLTRMSPERTTLAGGWHGVPIRIPLPGGAASATVVDGGNCFNLNSVVRNADAYANSGVRDGAPPVYIADSRGMQQLAGLLGVVGVPTNQSAQIAASLADWIDTDTTPLPGGAEDNAYAGLPAPYRTPNSLVVDPSELREVAGMTAEAYAAVKPWLCALPEAKVSPINVNTLSIEQAPLIAMLLPGQLGLEDARNLIARRPANGWERDAFWNEPLVKALKVAPEVHGQIVEKTRWFHLRLDVDLTGVQMQEDALIDAGSKPARLVSRNWGQD